MLTPFAICLRSRGAVVSKDEDSRSAGAAVYRLRSPISLANASARSACLQAAHGDHQGQPAGVGVRAPMPPKPSAQQRQRSVTRWRGRCGELARVCARSRRGAKAANASTAGGLHQVDDDAGDRDVEPDGEGPARQPLCAGKRPVSERKNVIRISGSATVESTMCGEQSVASRTATSVEAVEAGLAVQGEVHQVGDQEDRREEEGEDIEARWCRMRRSRISWKPVTSAMVASALSTALTSGSERSCVPATSVGAWK